MSAADTALLPDGTVLVEQTPGVYRRGRVTIVGIETVTVQFAGAEEAACDRTCVWPANEADCYVDDAAALFHLSDATVLENMRIGLEKGQIYMWVGGILTAVNPMRPLANLYKEQMMERCRETTASADAAPAHPFVQAELALADLARRRQSASFVVSGESGSGKTETAKHILAYCLWRSGHRGPLSSTLLDVAPVIELFGSAATIHNANSSRIGRYLKLHCGVGRGEVNILQAELQTFLLERSRVVSVGAGERGFHVFYGLLASPLAATIGLSALGAGPASYGYLSAGLSRLDARDDAADFARMVQHSFALIGLSDGEVRSLANLLGSVLVLGNVTFEAGSADDDDVGGAAAHGESPEANPNPNPNPNPNRIVAGDPR